MSEKCEECGHHMEDHVVEDRYHYWCLVCGSYCTRTEENP